MSGAEFPHSLFRLYWKDRKPWRFPAQLLVLLTIVWWLHGLPWQPMAYISLLLSAAVLVNSAFDLRLYRRQLQRAAEVERRAGQELFSTAHEQSMENAGASGLETAWSLAAEAWQRRCLEAREKQREEKERSSRYYTLWSHQVKTPAAAMELLLQEETLDRRALEQELLKVEQYVNMALQYQRLDCSGRDLVLKEYPLESLVKKAVKHMASAFIYNKVSVRLADLEGTVLTDEKWFLFVLEQILGNAVKYAPKGEICIYVPEESPGELVVEDNGIGIRAEDVPRVFDWGYTGYNGRRETRSTGIGLYLCRQTMDMLGQSLRLRSVEGKGTKVYLGIARKRFAIE